MSLGERRRYLVAYDVADDGRRNEVFTTLQGFGDWTQYSVFLCELTAQELVQLRGRLRGAINEREDQVLIVDLGRAVRPVENNIEVLGKRYEPPIRTNII